MPIQTPICDFGQKAHDFKLKSTEGKILSLTDVKGEKGTLISFPLNTTSSTRNLVFRSFISFSNLIHRF